MLSPHRALSVAVRNEEQAFTFRDRELFALLGEGPMPSNGMPTGTDQSPGGKASDPVEEARSHGLLDPGALTRADVLQLARRDAEETLRICLDIADSAQHEQLMCASQEYAQYAMGRLAVFNTWLDQA